MKLEGADSEITFFPNKNENTNYITTRTLNVSQLMENLDIQRIMTYLSLINVNINEFPFVCLPLLE